MALQILVSPAGDGWAVRSEAFDNELLFEAGGRAEAAARALADRISAGTVWINKHGMIQPDPPFGGVRQSGIGVQFGAEGLRECTNVKTIIS